MMKEHTRQVILVISVLLCSAAETSCRLGGTYPRTLTASQKAAMKADIYETRHEAEVLAHRGEYSQAFRLLFDKAYTVRQIGLRIEFETADECVRMVDQAISSLEDRLIHTEESPLMAYLRNSDVPIQERLAEIRILWRLAATHGQDETALRFRGDDGGTLVRMMRDQRLSPSEKQEIVWWVATTIQAQYVSETEQQATREEIARLLHEADQRFHAQQYVEAFLLLTEATQYASDIQLCGKQDRDLRKQRVRLFKTFVHLDNSDLMQVFKDQRIPNAERQDLLYVLMEMEFNHAFPDSALFVLEGTPYGGTLVQILTHPHIGGDIKHMILGNIEQEILRHEPGYKSKDIRGIEKFFEQQRKDAE